MTPHIGETVERRHTFNTATSIGGDATRDDAIPKRPGKCDRTRADVIDHDLAAECKEVARIVDAFR
jgi:hypothetical protein